MSIIEKAAQRLEQLRKAGVDIVDGLVTPGSEAMAPAAAPGEAAVHGAPDTGLPYQEGRRPERLRGAQGTPARRVDIDLVRLAASGIVTPTAPRSQIADEFRVVKRPLIGNAMGRGAAPVANGNLIMITSALPGEGKSFSAINLAMSIAMELDSTILLVDADVARPSVLTTLGLPPAKGLLDLLTDDSLDPGEVLLRTNVETLSILPSGTPHQRATELLASDAMLRLLEELAHRYPDRIVVFDSPPLLVTTEARVLAQHMGQVVVIVEANRTSHGEVKQALATIDSCPVKMVMLNKSRQSREGGYYGYYGYQGYQGYQGYEHAG